LDLFATFPILAASDSPTLHGRNLRLIGLSALLYDAHAFYFELADPRFWVMPPTVAAPLIGVGGTQCRVPETESPVTALAQHLRQTWRVQAEYFPHGHAYVLEGAALTQLPGATLTTPNLPYLLILTPPRLGGGNEVPDALVQAIYLLKLHRAPDAKRLTGLLRIEVTALGEFLAQDTWPLRELLAHPWATLDTPKPLPDAASLRLVLALRGLRALWQSGAWADLSTLTKVEKPSQG